MNNKKTLTVLTITFIVALCTALFYSYKQANDLSEKINRIAEIQSILEQKNDSLVIQNNEINKINEELYLANIILKENDSIIRANNRANSEKLDKLIDLRGNIDSYYYEALGSKSIEKYIRYLKVAIVGDVHYLQAIAKIESILDSKGYTRIVDSDGNRLIEEFYFLEFKKYSFYRVKKSFYASIDEPKSSYKIYIPVDDIVKVVKMVKYGNELWAEIEFHNKGIAAQL